MDRPPPERTLGFRALRCLSLLFFRSLHGFRVRGVENLPAQGPFIIAANHPSYFDPVLLSLASNRFIRFFALQEVIDVPVIGWIAREFGALPVTPETGSEETVQKAVRILRRGGILGIFPEGTRSTQRLMGGVRRGLGRLMVLSRAPCVPVSIEGAYEAWSRSANTPRPFRIEVTFHAPIALGDDDRRGKEDDREYHQHVSEIVARVIRAGQEKR